MGFSHAVISEDLVAAAMQSERQVGSDGVREPSHGRLLQHRDRRVSWDAEPDVIDLEWLSPSTGPVLYEWQTPTIAYLHLAVLFGSVCMTKDCLSLGYLALFLAGCATLTERAVWRKRSVTAWEAFMKAWPFLGARGGGLLLNAYVLAVSSFALAAFAFHAHLIFVKDPEVTHILCFR